MTGVRRRARAALAAGAAAALLGGLSACSLGGKPSSDTSLASSETTQTVTALGPRALRVGQTFTSDGESVTLREIHRPMTSRQPGQAPRDPGDEWIGLNVRACVAASAPEPVEAGWWTFAGLGKGGERYPGLVWSKKIKPLPSNNWPVPQYPTFGKIAPGQCEAGWLLLAGQKDKPLESVIFTDTSGAPRAEWKVRQE